MQKLNKLQPIQRQSGAVAIIVALGLLAMIGLLGLVLDLGHLYIAKTGLQNAADAAALSGAKQLDGSASGIDGAINSAREAAELNTFFGNNGQESVTITEADIKFSDSPDTDEDDWLSATQAKDNPAEIYFIKVDTVSGNLNTWFAPIWNYPHTNTFGFAVAGRFPPGALAPMFVPIVRRNANQKDDSPAYPNCKGYMYDPSYKDKVKDFTKSCPDPSRTPIPDNDPTDYRIYDFSGNWGFLKANECREYKSTTSNVITCPADLKTNPALYPGVEKGSYYVIAPRANNKWNTGSAYVWQVGASWNGNFGFMMKSFDEKTQKSLMAALCTGGGVTAYSVPGCGEVHTGQLSGPKTAANLNTRFDQQDNQMELTKEECPSDTNIYTSSWKSEGLYLDYLAGSPLTEPSPGSRPGKAKRRIVRVYIVDNVWLPGVDLTPSSAVDDCYQNKLTGGSHQAHLVGCADFFMWRPADSQGALYAEFVGQVPTHQCNNTASTFTEIRLYH